MDQDGAKEGPRVFAAKPTLRSVFAECDEVVAKIDQALKLEKELAVVNMKEVDDEESLQGQPAAVDRSNESMLGIIGLTVSSAMIFLMAPFLGRRLFPRNDKGGLELPANAPPIEEFVCYISVVSIAMGVVITLAGRAMEAEERLLLSTASQPISRWRELIWAVSGLVVCAILGAWNLTWLLWKISHA
jgi:hypothetical protein